MPKLWLKSQPNGKRMDRPYGLPYNAPGSEDLIRRTDGPRLARALPTSQVWLEDDEGKVLTVFSGGCKCSRKVSFYRKDGWLICAHCGLTIS